MAEFSGGARGLHDGASFRASRPGFRSRSGLTGTLGKEPIMIGDDANSQHHFPALEQLEQRLLLDGLAESQAIELFNVSPALFVENQGQWADESIRYAFQGSGANVLFTDGGPVFQVFQRSKWPIAESVYNNGLSG